MTVRAGTPRKGSVTAGTAFGPASDIRPFDFTHYFFHIIAPLLLCVLLNATAEGAQDPSGTVKAYLKANYPWAEVEVSELTVATEMPEGAPERITVERGPLGRAIFGIYYPDRNKLTVTATVKAFDWVLMTRRAYTRGYTLQREDSYATLMDVTRIPKGALVPGSMAAGKTLTRSIGANMPLTDVMVSESAIVKKGRRVMLVAQSDGFSITTKGEMKETGSVGSYVKVINIASRKLVSGLLVDDTTVRVDF